MISLAQARKLDSNLCNLTEDEFSDTLSDMQQLIQIAFDNWTSNRSVPNRTLGLLKGDGKEPTL